MSIVKTLVLSPNDEVWSLPEDKLGDVRFCASDIQRFVDMYLSKLETALHGNDMSSICNAAAKLADNIFAISVPDAVLVPECLRPQTFDDKHNVARMVLSYELEKKGVVTMFDTPVATDPNRILDTSNLNVVITQHLCLDPAELRKNAWKSLWVFLSDYPIRQGHIAEHIKDDKDVLELLSDDDELENAIKTATDKAKPSGWYNIVKKRLSALQGDNK